MEPRDQRAPGEVRLAGRATSSTRPSSRSSWGGEAGEQGHLLHKALWEKLLGRGGEQAGQAPGEVRPTGRPTTSMRPSRRSSWGGEAGGG